MLVPSPPFSANARGPSITEAVGGRQAVWFCQDKDAVTGIFPNTNGKWECSCSASSAVGCEGRVGGERKATGLKAINLQWISSESLHKEQWNILVSFFPRSPGNPACSSQLSLRTNRYSRAAELPGAGRQPPASYCSWWKQGAGQKIDACSSHTGA